MHSKINKRKIIINEKIDEFIKYLFDSVIKKHQIGLGKSVRDSEFKFDCVHLLYCKCHKVDPNRHGSYIGFSDWIKNKKPTINPVNKNGNKCVQLDVTNRK